MDDPKKSIVGKQGMGNGSKQGKDLNAAFYAVAFIDFLGQRERLASIDDKDIFEGRRDKLIPLLQQTFGRVTQFRKVLADLVATLTEPYGPQGPLRQMTAEEYARLTARKVGVEFFGDAALLKVCLASEETIPPLSINAMLQAVAISHLTYLGGEMPIRGGIEVGWGWEVTENALYGTMVPRVLKLEEEEAEYPRILVGPVLMDYLRGVPQEFPNAQDPAHRLARATALHSLDRIVTDDDGKFALNSFDGNSVPHEEFPATLTKATEFAQRCAREFAAGDSDRDRKLAARYERLVKFIERFRKLPESK